MRRERCRSWRSSFLFIFFLSGFSLRTPLTREGKRERSVPSPSLLFFLFPDFFSSLLSPLFPRDRKESGHIAIVVRATCPVSPFPPFPPFLLSFFLILGTGPRESIIRIVSLLPPLSFSLFCRRIGILQERHALYFLPFFFSPPSFRALFSPFLVREKKGCGRCGLFLFSFVFFLLRAGDNKDIGEDFYVGCPSFFPPRFLSLADGCAVGERERRG